MPSPILLPTRNEVRAIDLKAALLGEKPCTVLDVRDPVQFSICKLSMAFSLPLRGILEQPEVTTMKLRGLMIDWDSELFVLCRRGVDSRFATHALLKFGFGNVRNVVGGLDAWRRDADPSFPLY